MSMSDIVLAGLPRGEYKNLYPCHAFSRTVIHAFYFNDLYVKSVNFKI